MPQRAGDHGGPAEEPAASAQVEITVIPGPRGPTVRERIGAGRNRRVIGCLVAATLAAGALVAGVSLTGRGGTGATSRLPTTVLPNTVLYPTYLRYTGPGGTVIASASPLRCLGLLIALHDPSVMNAAFDRAVPCGRPRGPNTLIAIRGPRSGGARRAPPGARSPRR